VVATARPQATREDAADRGAVPWAAPAGAAAVEVAPVETADRAVLVAQGQGQGTLGRSSASEAVTDAVNRLYVAGLTRFRLDLAAQVLNVGVNRPFVRFEGDPV
jgi:hypothetical protein